MLKQTKHMIEIISFSLSEAQTQDGQLEEVRSHDWENKSKEKRQRKPETHGSSSFLHFPETQQYSLHLDNLHRASPEEDRKELTSILAPKHF